MSDTAHGGSGRGMEKKSCRMIPPATTRPAKAAGSLIQVGQLSSVSGKAALDVSPRAGTKQLKQFCSPPSGRRTPVFPFGPCTHSCRQVA